MPEIRVGGVQDGSGPCDFLDTPQLEPAPCLALPRRGATRCVGTGVGSEIVAVTNVFEAAKRGFSVSRGPDAKEGEGSPKCELRVSAVGDYPHLLPKGSADKDNRRVSFSPTLDYMVPSADQNCI